MAANWVKIFNRLFTIINTPGDSYYSGSQFLAVLREIDPETPSYQQLIAIRNQENKSTSRKDYYYDLMQALNDIQRTEVYNNFIERLEAIVPDKIEALKELLVEGAVGPVALIPSEVWSSDRLTAYLEEMDASIIQQNYNQTLTLAYTCLEGFYKAFIRSKIPAQIALNELIPMAVEIRNYLRTHLNATGIPYPEQMITLISTITSAICNSRNHFSNAHFADESDKWLAELARDQVNSIVRLLLKFI